MHASESDPHLFVAAHGVIGPIDRQHLIAFLITQSQQLLNLVELVSILTHVQRMRQSQLAMTLSLRTGDDSRSSNSCVTHIHSPKYLRQVLCRLSTRRLTVFLRQVSKNSPPNRTYTSRRIRLSTNFFSLNFPRCRSLWQLGHNAMVLRFRADMSRFQLSFPFRSLRLRTWCIISLPVAPHNSHFPL